MVTEFLIPSPKTRCHCGHFRDQHALGKEKCDNCKCHIFRLDRARTAEEEARKSTESDLKGDMCVTPGTANPSHNKGSESAGSDHRGSADIVGIISHPFQGTQELCQGILGYSSTDSRHGEKCNQPRNAEIHKFVELISHRPTEIPDSGLKDSGQRLSFPSGMVRDIDDTKPAFDLVIPEGIPYSELMLTRWAELLRKGAIKYSRRNWERADSQEELDRAKASAFRHFMQWFTGETDEDHAAAVFFNVNEVETIRYKQKVKESG